MALLSYLFSPEISEEQVKSILCRLREDIERKKISLQATLKRGLKNMPNEWLANMCTHFGLFDCRLRSQKEEKIVDYLMQEKELALLVGGLEENKKALLSYLLQQGGWARLQPVTRKFGPMKEDGYYWHEEDPVSTLGFLWSRALVMVGRTILHNRNTRVGCPAGAARTAGPPFGGRKQFLIPKTVRGLA